MRWQDGDVPAGGTDAGGTEGKAVAPAVDGIQSAASSIWGQVTHNYEAWLYAAAWIVTAWIAGWLAYRIFFAVVKRIALHRIPFLRRRGASKEGERTRLGELALPPIRRPLSWLFPILTVKLFAIPLVRPEDLPAGAVRMLDHVLSLALIGAMTWLVVGVVVATERVIDARHRIDVADNLDARRVQTQIEVIRQVLVVLVVIVGLAAALMTFDSVRQFGASILASAGLAGLVVGFAARPLLENIISGIQVALAQPIRLDDVVIINGEWGRIEEITTTYVVLRIWDQRRLIVPFSKILSEPFENWTRTTAEILGTVYLHTDYTAPVDEIREELKRFVKDHPKWDGRVAGLQVTDASERTMELRGLVSAADASKAWDLRCDLREHLIAYLQERHPDSLPRDREEWLPNRLDSREHPIDG